MLNFGGFLSSNFWTNYRCQSSASVEDLLNSKDCTVEKLLDDDDCLQELRNFNDKLIKYFDHDKLKVLIDYITVMPPEDADHNRGHKYPFISGEIFNCEINQILDKFFEAPVRAQPEPSGTEEDEKEADKESDDKRSETEKEEDSTPLGEVEPTEPKKEESPEETTDRPDTPIEAPEEGKEPAESGKTEAAPTEAPAEPEAAEEKKEETTPETATPETVTPATPATEEAPEATTEPAGAQPTPAATELPESDQNSQEPESEEGKKPEEKKPEEEKNGEPEEEANDKKEGDTLLEDGLLDTVESTQQTLATETNEEDDEQDNKYVLLDRLFKFVRQEPGDDELNPVLSGYFFKLVSLLISRKQKLLVPYIFAPESDVMESMINHIGNKSVSEILNKLVNQIDSDYEPSLQEQIRQKQKMVVEKIIAHLGPEKSEESNLNASSIIQDMFDNKDFYNMFLQKQNVQQILAYAAAPMSESTKSSKISSLAVFNQIIFHHIDKQKKKDHAKDSRKDNDDEDDMIIQQNSDDENNEDLEASNPCSLVAQANVLVEILIEKIPDLEVILQPDHDLTQLQGSIVDRPYTPLGQQRLRSVELVLKMVQMKKEALNKALLNSKVFSNVMELVKQFPWNNFLQLKVINLFTEIVENCDNLQFRKDFLKASGVGQALVEMSEKNDFELESERKIRNGYMALVISVANKLQKKYDGSANSEGMEDNIMVEYLDSVGEEWRKFVDVELKNSNEKNNKTLGGCTSRNNASEEDDKDDNNYDVQMEKIMARFTNFNQILSQNPSNNDEDDDDDDDTHEDKEENNFDEDDDNDSAPKPEGTEADYAMKIQPVVLKEAEDLEDKFSDHNYWKLEENDSEVDVDALLAELDD